jgi:hypothetical protein
VALSPPLAEHSRTPHLKVKIAARRVGRPAHADQFGAPQTGRRQEPDHRQIPSAIHILIPQRIQEAFNLCVVRKLHDRRTRTRGT